MKPIIPKKLTVLASGVFDVIHPGHVHYLEQARAMGERLVVVVASDGHAARSKRLPLHSAAERAKLVGSLRIVDEVVIGSDPYDLEATLKLTRPDVIALGHDQGFDEGVLAAECRDLKWPVRVDRVDKLPGAKAATRDII